MNKLFSDIKKGDAFRFTGSPERYLTATADVVNDGKRGVSKVLVNGAPHIVTALGHAQVEVQS